MSPLNAAPLVDRSPIGIGESFATCDSSSTSSTLILSTNNSCSADANPSFLESIEQFFWSQPHARATTSFRPKFYLFLKSKNSAFDSTSEMKLDGIALNLLVTPPSDTAQSVVDYNRLYSALIRLLNAGSRAFNYDKWYNEFLIEV